MVDISFLLYQQKRKEIKLLIFPPHPPKSQQPIFTFTARPGRNSEMEERMLCDSPLLGDDASSFSFEQSPNTLTKGHGGKNALFFSSFTRAKKVGGQGGRKYLRRAAPLLFFCALLRVCNKPYLFECPSRLLRKMKKGENRRRERESQACRRVPPPPFSLSLQREKNASADL